MDTIQLLTSHATSLAANTASGTSGDAGTPGFTTHLQNAQGSDSPSATGPVGLLTAIADAAPTHGDHVPSVQALLRWLDPAHLPGPGSGKSDGHGVGDDKDRKHALPAQDGYALLATIRTVLAQVDGAKGGLQTAAHPKGLPQTTTGRKDHAKGLPQTTTVRKGHAKGGPNARQAAGKLVDSLSRVSSHRGGNLPDGKAPPAQQASNKHAETLESTLARATGSTRNHRHAGLQAQDSKAAGMAAAQATSSHTGAHGASLKAADKLAGQWITANKAGTPGSASITHDHHDPGTQSLIAPATAHGNQLGPTTTAKAPATPMAPALQQAVGSTPWQHELGQQVVRMTRQGDHKVELQLHPKELGPLQISLKVDHQGAQAQFLVAHAQVRDAVQQAIPQLREALAQHGIALGEAMVGQQQQHDTQPGQDDSPRRAMSPVGSVSDAEPDLVQATGTHPARPAGTAGPGLDLYA